MEHNKNQYEKPKIEISFFNDQDLLTTSQGSGAGDGWVKDPFIEN